jgi:hypothetical protein
MSAAFPQSARDWNISARSWKRALDAAASGIIRSDLMIDDNMYELLEMVALAGLLDRDNARLARHLRDAMMTAEGVQA